MGKHASEVWLNYFEVFNENSSNQRRSFFSDPIIQYLWSNFRANYGFQLEQYLYKIRASDMDEVKK